MPARGGLLRLPESFGLALPGQFLLTPLLLLGAFLPDRVGQAARAGRTGQRLKNLLPLELPAVHGPVDDVGRERRHRLLLEVPGDGADSLLQLSRRVPFEIVVQGR